MRTGTHLLIDLLLNNFPDLQQKPLYIDLDRYLEGDFDPSALEQCGNCVIKSHYPQGWQTPEADEIVKRLAQRSVIVEPTRDLDVIEQSLLRFWPEKGGDELRESFRRCEVFWSESETTKFPFESLVDPSGLEENLKNLAKILPYERGKKSIGPRDRGDTSAVLFDKLLTRTLGAKAPRLNTTIQFAK